MKKFSKLLSLVLALCMLLSLGVMASNEAPAAASSETATKDVSDMEASEYATLTNYTNRDNTGEIYVGTDVASDEMDVDVNEIVTGAAYTSVYAHDNATVNLTGSISISDDTAGESASDFNGQGAAVVAYNGATVNINDAAITADGFERSDIIVSENSVVNVYDTTLTSLGANPLTEAYDGYVNSANQNIMLSPPWCLGIQGGSRIVNMIGTTPTLNIVDSELVSGGWALISTDSGSNMMINVVDTTMTILPESEGGMDSGWRIFGYDEDAYGSGYGAYYIGNPTQNYYGVTMNGVTYAAIITGATSGLYTSSEGDIDIYDANGNLVDTVEGEGNITTINGVFGFMMHNSLDQGITVNEGTTVNTADAIVIYKAANGDFYFDDAVLNSAKGVLFQMIDNDDDSRIGMISMDEGFSTTYDESKIDAGVGFPGINYDCTSSTGGNDVTVTYTNGSYEGNIYNGTGYYGQTGDNLTVTVGENGVLTGDIALTSTIKGIPYSAEAVEGIAYYGDDIGYTLLDADGNATEDEAEAAYIQFNSYTINEYFLQGHVENMVHYNGASTISVVVADTGLWEVTGESLVTSLTVEDGAVVMAAVTENADGTVTLTPSEDPLPAGTYGGSVEVVGGAGSVGGGVTADGTLDVEAAADAIAVNTASEEASAEASAETAALETKSTADMEASEYSTLTNYTNRDSSGEIYVGNDVTGSAEIELNEAVEGTGYTAVFAHGADADVTVTGTLVLEDDSDGKQASDFNGQGTAIVAYDGANVLVEDTDITTNGFERNALVISENAVATVKNSTFTIGGADPLTEAWEGYHSSADQNNMISPPWPLGIMGGGRVLNMIGTTPTLNIIGSTLTASRVWGLLSTDSGSNMMLNIVDTTMTSLSEAEGGSDSGWRIFGYDEDAYGSAYGSYYIGNPTQNYYGVTMNGLTYAAIITGAEAGHYASSNGDIDIYDANGNLLETVEGEGNVTTINSVFGFMMHNSINDAIYVEDGTVINSADAIVIYKAADGAFVFDNAELNSAKGVLFQMMDNDDDSRIGGSPMSVEEGFDENYSDSKIDAGEGFPGIAYDVTTSTGGNTMTVTYTNGDYEGNIYNGTGYYGQTGDNLVLNIGEGAALTGDVALTSTIKGVAYSEDAIEGIEYYGDDIQYVLLDAEGQVTEDAADAAFIQITDYTINEYFLQGHVENLLHYNGASTISVTVADGAVWTVANESLVTELVVEDGATVYAAVTENADGSITLTASDEALPAGTYGGTAEVVGGGQSVGGGVTDDGTLDVAAAAAAIAVDDTASEEASAEADTSVDTETVVELILDSLFG